MCTCTAIGHAFYQSIHVCAVPSFHARVLLRVVSILEIHVNNVYVKDSYFGDDLIVIIEDEDRSRPVVDLDPCDRWSTVRLCRAVARARTQAVRADVSDHGRMGRLQCLAKVSHTGRPFRFTLRVCSIESRTSRASRLLASLHARCCALEPSRRDHPLNPRMIVQGALNPVNLPLLFRDAFLDLCHLRSGLPSCRGRQFMRG